MPIMKEKLIEMIKKGKPDKEIMEELGIQTKSALRRMYYDALVEAGKIKDIVTEKEFRKAMSKRRILTIGKRETILLSNALLVERFGFKEGDSFRVAKRRGNVILTKTE